VSRRWSLRCRSAAGAGSLRDADPRTPPHVNPGYLTDPADLDVLVASSLIAQGITARPPLRDLATAEVAPGGVAATEKAIRARARATVGSMFHPTSTCAMGAGDEAVCDPSLRVRGVAGLRVVDASVMPAITCANTNAPAIPPRNALPISCAADPSAEAVVAAPGLDRRHTVCGADRLAEVTELAAPS
jgi:choline dehydrogenase